MSTQQVRQFLDRRNIARRFFDRHEGDRRLQDRRQAVLDLGGARDRRTGERRGHDRRRHDRRCGADRRAHEV